MIRRILPRLLGAALLLAVAFLALPAISRQAEEEKLPGKLPPDLALVPRDAVFFVSARYAEVIQTPAAKALIASPGAASTHYYLKNTLHLAPENIERLTVTIRRPDQGQIVIARTIKPYDAAAVRRGLGATTTLKIHGQTIHAVPGGAFGDAVWTVDDRTLVFGRTRAMAPYLASLAKAGKSHPLAGELATAAGKHSLTLAVLPSLFTRTETAANVMRAATYTKGFKGSKKDPDAPRFKDAPPIPEKRPEGPPALDPKSLEEQPLKLGTLEDAFEKMDRWGPVSAPFRPALRCQRLLATADVGAEIKVNARAAFDSESEARDGLVIARVGVVTARELAPAMFRMNGIDFKASGLDKFVKEIQGVLRGAKLTRAGKTVTASAEGRIDTRALASYLSEQVPILKQANNLKQIGLAIHSYHDSYNRLPGNITDKDGKPLLSWRVAILPYVEQYAMYKALHLNEPWDSAHNKKVLAKMPSIYAPVKGETPEPGMTFLQMFTGPGTLWPGKGAKPQLFRIFDGTSNTIAVAEASTAVHWAKPVDMVVTARVLPKLGGQFPKFFHVLMLDGSVQKFRRDYDEKLMRLAINPADGFPIDFSKLTP